jgi:hypothetical protein
MVKAGPAVMQAGLRVLCALGRYVVASSKARHTWHRAIPACQLCTAGMIAEQRRAKMF